jgi:hypothetical protein
VDATESEFANEVFISEKVDDKLIATEERESKYEDRLIKDEEKSEREL